MTSLVAADDNRATLEAMLREKAQHKTDNLKKFRDHQVNMKTRAQTALNDLMKFTKEVNADLKRIQNMIDALKAKFSQPFLVSFLTH